jgi:acyl-CoA reductase-like NAD-dependent aldehyde dehydrogenase
MPGSVCHEKDQRLDGVQVAPPLTDSMMLKTISPVDGCVVVERKCHTEQEISSMLDRGTKAFQTHRRTPLSTRIAIASKFLDLLLEQKDILVTPANPFELMSGCGADKNDGKAH